MPGLLRLDLLVGRGDLISAAIAADHAQDASVLLE